MKNGSSGLFNANITANTICPHSSVAYIDMNLKVRDYIISDFQVELSKIIKKISFLTISFVFRFLFN